MPDSVQRHTATVLVLIAASVWAGLLIGVSFIATPVKFMAPSLTLPVALDVGRHTFSVFNKVEIGFALVLVLLILWGARSALFVAIGVILAAIICAEALWLLPALDARVTIIIAGQEPPPSLLHYSYVVLEGAKAVALLVLIVAAARSVAQRLPPGRKS